MHMSARQGGPSVVPLTPPQRQSAVDAAAAAIREGVRALRYAPGQRLIEADLTRELGISRGSLREAFGRLAAEGLVVLETHRGATVRRLSRHDTEELFTVRAVLEGEAARLAATTIGREAHRARLRGCVAELERVSRERRTGEYLSANANFHTVLVEVSGNRLLRELIERLNLPQFRAQFHDLLFEVEHPGRLLDHSAIARAVLRGDTTNAERAMRSHVRAVARATLALPDQAFGPG